jgi:hypothetical protein
MPDPERFEPVLDLCLDLFQCVTVGLATVHVGVKNIDVRAQCPEIDVVDAGTPFTDSIAAITSSIAASFGANWSSIRNASLNIERDENRITTAITSPSRGSTMVWPVNLIQTAVISTSTTTAGQMTIMQPEEPARLTLPHSSRSCRHQRHGSSSARILRHTRRAWRTCQQLKIWHAGRIS